MTRSRRVGLWKEALEGLGKIPVFVSRVPVKVGQAALKARAFLVLTRRASFYQVFYVFVFVNERVAEQGAKRFSVHDDRHPSSHAMDSMLRFNCA
jgi:hypothetical protein